MVLLPPGYHIMPRPYISPPSSRRPTLTQQYITIYLDSTLSGRFGLWWLLLYTEPDGSVFAEARWHVLGALRPDPPDHPRAPGAERGPEPRAAGTRPPEVV